MAWSAPTTWVANTVLTAAQLNAQLRDNMLQTAPALATGAGNLFVSTGVNSIAERELASANVATAQNTASLTYTNLTTVGPSVTVDTGTNALVLASAAMSNSVATDGAAVSYSVGGVSAIAGSDARSITYTSSAISELFHGGFSHVETGLTPGSNVFTLVYRAVTGGTATFQFRELIVLAL